MDTLEQIYNPIDYGKLKTEFDKTEEIIINLELGIDRVKTYLSIIQRLFH